MNYIPILEISTSIFPNSEEHDLVSFDQKRYMIDSGHFETILSFSNESVLVFHIQLNIYSQMIQLKQIEYSKFKISK